MFVCEMLPLPSADNPVNVSHGKFAVQLDRNFQLTFESFGNPIEPELLDDIGCSPLFEKTKKVAIITGADGTLGSEIVKNLLSRGFKIHALVGDKEKASKVFKSEAISITNDKLKIHTTRLDDPFEVLDFAESMAFKESPINLIFLCAGVMLAEERYIDGVESHMCINVVSQALLLETIKCNLADDARIVALSSVCSRAAYLPPNFDKKNTLSTFIGPYQSYAFSKFVLSAYVQHLADYEKLPIVSLHPGVVPGNLYRNVNYYFRFIILNILPFFMRTARFSSILILHTALKEDFTPGSYYENTEICNIHKKITEKDRETIYDHIKKQMSTWCS